MTHTTIRRPHSPARLAPLLACLAALLPAAGAGAQRPPDAAGHGFLHADGQRIVDGNGREVLLRGMGLGGWMLQEGYMLRTAGPQHVIEARIEELVGREGKEAFYDAWLANHTRRVDVDSLAAWGFNSIRLPMHYKWFIPALEEEPVPGEIGWRERGFRMVDELLEWAAAHRMYVILDLHAAPGGQGMNADINDYDPGKPSLWESPANQERTVELWRRLAERYREEPWMGGYDLINEPNWGFEDLADDPNGCEESGNAPLWALQQRITAAIREVDPHHMIIIEGNCWGNNYRSLPELWDDNLVISFHKYWNYNDPASIEPMLAMRSERNVPVWLGESGENSNTWFTNAIRLLEAHGVGWAWWPLKKLGVNNPLEIVAPAGYHRIRAYWAEEGPRPPPDEALRTLMELAEMLKLEHNIHHRDVVDAMIRQPHTTAVLPFRDHVITATGTNRILAVDYDLGRQGFAYSDADTANYRVSTGWPGSDWNRGRTYRNDGVDIAIDTTGLGDPREPGESRESGEGASARAYVGWTEPGEWLQYTVTVLDPGAYTLVVEYADAGAAAGAAAGVAAGVAAGAAAGVAAGVAAVSVRLDDGSVAEGVILPPTGGETAWADATLTGLRLPPGLHRLRIVVEQGGFNLRALRLQLEGDRLSPP